MDEPPAGTAVRPLGEPQTTPAIPTSRTPTPTPTPTTPTCHSTHHSDRRRHRPTVAATVQRHWQPRCPLRAPNGPDGSPPPRFGRANVPSARVFSTTTPSSRINITGHSSATKVGPSVSATTCGRAVALPQGILTKASHTTDNATGPTRSPTSETSAHDGAIVVSIGNVQPTMARSSSVSGAGSGDRAVATGRGPNRRQRIRMRCTTHLEAHVRVHPTGGHKSAGSGVTCSVSSRGIGYRCHRKIASGGHHGCNN